ncbi:MAG TPA: anthranilate phosphoribosyltransferase [Acidimicrobiales bacterium]|jgi:anthranilate phosphoribosyltransferase|nr:anthranilate phosphoribosyltransferase [Acidimicrobiales bacterium]
MTVTLEELGGWPFVLGRLASGGDLSAAEAAAAMRDVFAGNATPSQLAAFIFGLRCKGETVEEMTGFVQAMTAAAELVPLTAELRERVIDTCGTGGDRSGTINVSTIAAFVVAGAGVPVCKHGNRAASSKAGSADLLEALGVAISLGPEQVSACIEEAGIGFCFAPRFHPSMRHAGPTRRELGVPTVFNFLGPLANPARTRRQVVGVSDPSMADKMVGVLAANGATSTMVVYGHDGLDELTTTDRSTVVSSWVDASGERHQRTYQVDPVDLGLARVAKVELLGGDAADNASAARGVLQGERGARRDIVLLNAAAGLMVAGVAPDFREGLELAATVVDDGRAAAALDRLIDVSQRVSAD